LQTFPPLFEPRVFAAAFLKKQRTVGTAEGTPDARLMSEVPEARAKMVHESTLRPVTAASFLAKMFARWLDALFSTPPNSRREPGTSAKPAGCSWALQDSEP
jgi:hypothetical protein